MHMRSRLFVLFLTVLILSMLQPVAAQEDDAAAQEILRMLNSWRVDNGVWPLRENPVLDRMAFDQATYILSLPSIPAGGAIHIGSFGEDPPTRAQLPRYNWPNYGGSQFTAVGEIAYVGHSAAAARAFWENSTVHRNTSLNPAYREIGVAALPHPFGHIYFVDFGSRPNILPVTADLQTNTLYLTNERYSGAHSPWFRNALKVRLFDADGRPLESDWIPWDEQIPLPPNAGSQLYVEYFDGGTGMVLAPVSFQQQAQAPVLPSPTPTFTPTSTPTRTPTATPTARPTSRNSATPGSSPTPGGIATVATAIPTAIPTAQPTAALANNVIVLYDSRSFTLINTAQTPLNVQEISFAGNGTTFSVTRWATQWLSGSLSALAASDCLQAWSFLETSVLDKPSSCRQRRSVLTISPQQMFWKQGDFDVNWRGSVLVTCHSSDHVCEFAVGS